jgi:predicted phosphodiesterase
MKIAIISDIHGNLEAFEQVLSDIDRQAVDAIISLGDQIGYGPDPDNIIDLVRRRHIPALVGNHELVVIDEDHLTWFNPTAQESLRKTIRLLSATSMAYIRRMPRFIIESEARFVHGFPPDSATTYLFQVSEAKLINTLATLQERLCFVGHTHELVLVTYNGHQITHKTLTRGMVHLQHQHRYIINVGSVGQPRDGDNNAKYVIWDVTRHRLEIRYIAYDIAAVAAKIKDRGLPQSHANRLW